jgi:ATP-dependent DNA helicase RecG
MAKRPFILDPLFRALTTLPGVGPKNAKLFEKLLGGPKVLDLLFHLPIDLIDRRFAPKIKDAPNEKIATITVRVDKHFPNPKKSLPYRVWCRDETGTINLTFFHTNKDWIQKQLPEGQLRVVSGKVEYYQGNPQIVHPDVVTPEERASLEILEPIYPLTQGLTNKAVRKANAGAFAFVTALPDWLDRAYKTRQGWAEWHEALRSVHFIPSPASQNSAPSPSGRGQGEGLTKARERLAFDELLANQLTLALVRHRQKRKSGRSFMGTGLLREKIMAALPYTLTRAQQRSLAEIYMDMEQPLKMLRLLQGDVGSGKTIVAAMAMIRVIESGSQAALLAPTEILARQHYEGLKPLFETAGIRVVALSGRDKGKARDLILQQIANGGAQIIIGTHAIFQDAVEFQDLGLAVIDEQHRFGVHQRLALSEKGKAADVLVMTATPIPRTLTLTSYGDMDVSRLDEKPPGRKPVDTRLIPSEKMDEMMAGIKRQLDAGARAYWVCPLVEESEKLDLAAATERYDILKHFYGDGVVGLIHGRLKPDEKDAVMEKFVRGDLKILVATTVIEVGVNVPEATIMVIEHAERFGLSQLHQLRGRVGRGGDKSYCFLLYYPPVGETAKERLSIMRETEDGFLIAEKDLELRGAGDILGTKQSGMLEFRLANLAEHAGLIQAARDDARLIIDRDPMLESERGKALRVLLYLFERDQAIKYLGSG